MNIKVVAFTVSEKSNYILTYADDAILVANTEEELHSFLNCLNSWSERNCLKINKDKSKIIHFRRPLMFDFSCGDLNLDITSQYKYLGLLVNEHLDYNITAKAVAQAASRALGLLLRKLKLLEAYRLAPSPDYMTLQCFP